MKRVEFHKTNHIFLDNGIIALHRYLKNRKNTEGVIIDLQDDKLVVESADLPQLLEAVYYEMGREIYDTYTTKQEQEAGNLYYIEAEDRFESFPKMNTYGFTELLTNNAQGTTSKDENFFTLDSLDAEEKKANKLDLSKPQNVEKRENILRRIFEKKEIAKKISAEFQKRGLKLLSKMYINEPYTKLTRLEPLNSQHLEEGDKICYLTGDKYKKLVVSTNTSPFISGLINFNSHTVEEDKKMSWKALYLSRFAAANCMYTYQYNNKNKKNPLYGDIIVYFLGANKLTDLSKIYDYYLKEGVGIRLPREIWKVDMDFIRNFRLYNFGKEKAVDSFIGKNEYLFMVLYTLFERIIRHLQPQQDEPEYADLLGEALSSSDFNQLNPYLISFRANAFSGGNKRPNNFDVFTQLRYSMQLFKFFETEKIDVLEILWSLKTIKPSLKKGSGDWNKISALERQSRDRILGLILRGQSILSEVEQIFYDSYRYHVSGESAGYKNYKQLSEFIELYESKINKKMNENLQTRAIKLGNSIGQGILGYGDGQRMTNAKQGRSYVIALRKSRTLGQFLEQIATIQYRYQLGISGEILEGIDETNFETIKQFAIIAALNQLNQQLSKTGNQQSTSPVNP